MQDALLATKLHVPHPRPEVVSRPRLMDRLDSGLHRKLTLISAPAGFGKTTLISQWADACECPVAWLSLDAEDGDLTRFLSYLVAAVQMVAEAAGDGALVMLKSSSPPSAAVILTSLLNDIHAADVPFTLILDDYYVLDSKSVDEALAFLLAHQPSQLHLVIATREDPYLPLARLRARDQLSELRIADLRFTFDEAAGFLNEIMGLNLAVEDIAALEARTEGWIAGLQLAAISMRGRRDVSGFIESFSGSHRFVMDYLVEEVLQQAPQHIQSFLLKTAILDRLTGPLCDALTGQGNGQQILETLDHANLFVIPLDNERCWYRYHHLFAELLRQQLQQTQPGSISDLHVRASEWFSQHGLHQEAIRHSLAAMDYPFAAAQIEAAAIDALQRGEHTTVIGWLSALPAELVKERPYLCVLHAWALQLTGQLEAAEARLTDAEHALDSSDYEEGEDTDTIRGLVHSHRAYLSFMRGEQDKVISYAHQALEQLPESAALIRAQTALYLGVAHRYRGEPQAAMDVYTGVLPAIREMGAQQVAVLSYMHLGDLHHEMAHLHQAKDFYEQALGLIESHLGRTDVPFAGYAYVSIGRILRQWNQLEEAYRLTSTGIALCREWNVADIMALSCIELAHIEQALGHDERARKAVDEARDIYGSFSPWGIQYAAAYQASLALARGDINAAVDWAQTTDLTLDGDFELHRQNEYLTLARVYLAQRRLEDTYTLAERIYQTAQVVERTQTVLEALILLALVCFEQHELSRALDYVEQALSIGEPEDYIRVFVDEGPPMFRLLREARVRGMAPEYTDRLLAAFPTSADGRDSSASPPAGLEPLIEPLSDRELEVLQLIAEGLSNREIGERLFLALSTVKGHNRNIFGKLHVQRRTEAVARARELGLL